MMTRRTPSVRPFHNHHVLLVGLTQYKNETVERYLGRITFAERDAQALYETFQRLGYPRSNLHLLTDHAATFEAIRRKLEEFRNRRSRCELLIVFWAGHGFSDGADQNHLVPWGADLDNPKTLLPVDELIQSVAGANANRVAAFLDTCFSRPVQGSVFRHAMWNRYQGQFVAARWALFVGASTYLALEHDERGGVLAECLTEALTGVMKNGAALRPFVDSPYLPARFVQAHLISELKPRADRLWGQYERGKCPQEPFWGIATHDELPIGLHLPSYIQEFLEHSNIPSAARKLALRAVAKRWPRS